MQEDTRDPQSHADAAGQQNLLPPENINPGVKPSWLDFHVPKTGIFLTGIEGSDPLVAGNVRRNLFLEAHNFYENFGQRLQNVHGLGLEWLRFGPPYSETHLGPGQYDFSFSDRVLEECDGLGLTVIADLLHFGLPEWMHESRPHERFFQNPDFPKWFAEYAEAFARRYARIQYFTLINEPFITALFSAKYGMWNEQVTGLGDDDRAFVRASANIAKAVILAREAVEGVKRESGQPKPVFVQNDSFEKAYTSPRSKRHHEVMRFNMRRFAALDLILGHRDPLMTHYMTTQEMPLEEYEWYMERGSRERVIIGVDHYPTCVHTYYPKRVVHHTVNHLYELYTLVREYWDRYKSPMLHTEANALTGDAPGICWQTYAAISQLRLEGFPVLGMGWYGDEYQVGWRHALCRVDKRYRGEENPVGLFYKGALQPVGEFFSLLASRGLPEIHGWEVEGGTDNN